MPFTLIQKLELQRDCDGAVKTEWNAAIERCLEIMREHDPWLPIDTAPVKTPIIAWAKEWVSPCEVLLDDDRVAYLPGSDCIPSPQPTHYQPMLEPPNVKP